MAQKAVRVEKGFAVPRESAVSTNRGLVRVFGEGQVLVVDTKEVKTWLDAGHLVLVESEVEQATAAPGEKRAVAVEARQEAAKKAKATTAKRKATGKK